MFKSFQHLWAVEEHVIDTQLQNISLTSAGGKNNKSGNETAAITGLVFVGRLKVKQRVCVLIRLKE